MTLSLTVPQGTAAGGMLFLGIVLLLGWACVFSLLVYRVRMLLREVKAYSLNKVFAPIKLTILVASMFWVFFIVSLRLQFWLSSHKGIEVITAYTVLVDGIARPVAVLGFSYLASARATELVLPSAAAQKKAYAAVAAVIAKIEEEEAACEAAAAQQKRRARLQREREDRRNLVDDGQSNNTCRKDGEGAGDDISEGNCSFSDAERLTINGKVSDGRSSPPSATDAMYANGATIPSDFINGGERRVGREQGAFRKEVIEMGRTANGADSPAIARSPRAGQGNDYHNVPSFGYSPAHQQEQQQRAAIENIKRTVTNESLASAGGQQQGQGQGQGQEADEANQFEDASSSFLSSSSPPKNVRTTASYRIKDHPQREGGVRAAEDGYEGGGEGHKVSGMKASMAAVTATRQLQVSVPATAVNADVDEDPFSAHLFYHQRTHSAAAISGGSYRSGYGGGGGSGSTHDSVFLDDAADGRTRPPAIVVTPPPTTFSGLSPKKQQQVGGGSTLVPPQATPTSPLVISRLSTAHSFFDVGGTGADPPYPFPQQQQQQRMSPPYGAGGGVLSVNAQQARALSTFSSSSAEEGGSFDFGNKGAFSLQRGGERDVRLSPSLQFSTSPPPQQSYGDYGKPPTQNVYEATSLAAPSGGLHFPHPGSDGGRHTHALAGASTSAAANNGKNVENEKMTRGPEQTPSSSASPFLPRVTGPPNTQAAAAHFRSAVEKSSVAAMISVNGDSNSNFPTSAAAEAVAGHHSRNGAISQTLQQAQQAKAKSELLSSTYYDTDHSAYLSSPPPSVMNHVPENYYQSRKQHQHQIQRQGAAAVTRGGAHVVVDGGGGVQRELTVGSNSDQGTMYYNAHQSSSLSPHLVGRGRGVPNTAATGAAGASTPSWRGGDGYSPPHSGFGHNNINSRYDYNAAAAGAGSMMEGSIESYSRNQSPPEDQRQFHHVGTGPNYRSQHFRNSNDNNNNRQANGFYNSNKSNNHNHNHHQGGLQNRQRRNGVRGGGRGGNAAATADDRIGMDFDDINAVSPATDDNYNDTGDSHNRDAAGQNYDLNTNNDDVLHSSFGSNVYGVGGGGAGSVVGGAGGSGGSSYGGALVGGGWGGGFSRLWQQSLFTARCYVQGIRGDEAHLPAVNGGMGSTRDDEDEEGNGHNNGPRPLPCGVFAATFPGSLTPAPSPAAPWEITARWSLIAGTRFYTLGIVILVAFYIGLAVSAGVDSTVDCYDIREVLKDTAACYSEVSEGHFAAHRPRILDSLGVLWLSLFILAWSYNGVRMLEGACGHHVTAIRFRRKFMWILGLLVANWVWTFLFILDPLSRGPILGFMEVVAEFLEASLIITIALSLGNSSGIVWGTNVAKYMQKVTCLKVCLG